MTCLGSAHRIVVRRTRLLRDSEVIPDLLSGGMFGQCDLAKFATCRPTSSDGSQNRGNVAQTRPNLVDFNRTVC